MTLPRSITSQSVAPLALAALLLLAPIAFGLKGTPVRMLTRGRVFVVNSGETIRLECEFHADHFNLFDNPILWRKTQLEEETQINMMGNLMEPFESSRRFRVSFVQRPSRYNLTLYIAETYQEDSGNYSCEVNGPQNSLLGIVTHQIFVRAPIESLSVEGGGPFDGILTLNPEVIDPEKRSERRLVFEENSPATLQCIANGGYPPPDITVQLGNDDITNQLPLSHTVRLNGSPALRALYYRTVRGLRSFSAKHTDDGKQVRCTVTVPGLMSNITLAKIIVHYAPIITCEQRYASVGERNAFVRCQVRSKPDMTATFWIIDVNGTTLSEGEVINEYWSSVMYRTDGIFEMQLSLREAKMESFRSYTIVAENSVGVRSKDVHLKPKPGEQGASQTKHRGTPETPLAREEELVTSRPFETKDHESRNLIGGPHRTNHQTIASMSPQLAFWAALTALMHIHHH